MCTAPVARRTRLERPGVTFELQQHVRQGNITFITDVSEEHY